MVGSRKGLKVVDIVAALKFIDDLQYFLENLDVAVRTGVGS